MLSFHLIGCILFFVVLDDALSFIQIHLVQIGPPFNHTTNQVSPSSASALLLPFITYVLCVCTSGTCLIAILPVCSVQPSDMMVKKSMEINMMARVAAQIQFIHCSLHHIVPRMQYVAPAPRYLSVFLFLTMISS